MTVLHTLTDEQLKKRIEELHGEFDNELYFREVRLPRLVENYDFIEKTVKKAKTVEDLIISLKNNSSSIAVPDGDIKEVIEHAKEVGFLEVSTKGNPYITATVDIQSEGNFILDNYFNIIRMEKGDEEVIEDVEIHAVRAYLEETLCDMCGRRLSVGDEIYHVSSPYSSSVVHVQEAVIEKIFPLTRNVRISGATVKAHNCLRKFVK